MGSSGGNGASSLAEYLFGAAGGSLSSSVANMTSNAYNETPDMLTFLARSHGETHPSAEAPTRSSSRRTVSAAAVAYSHVERIHEFGSGSCRVFNLQEVSLNPLRGSGPGSESEQLQGHPADHHTERSAESNLELDAGAELAKHSTALLLPSAVPLSATSSGLLATTSSSLFTTTSSGLQGFLENSQKAPTTSSGMFTTTSSSHQGILTSSAALLAHSLTPTGAGPGEGATGRSGIMGWSSSSAHSPQNPLLNALPPAGAGSAAGFAAWSAAEPASEAPLRPRQGWSSSLFSTSTQALASQGLSASAAALGAADPSWSPDTLIGGARPTWAAAGSTWAAAKIADQKRTSPAGLERDLGRRRLPGLGASGMSGLSGMSGMIGMSGESRKVGPKSPQPELPDLNEPAEEVARERRGGPDLNLSDVNAPDQQHLADSAGWAGDSQARQSQQRVSFSDRPSAVVLPQQQIARERSMLQPQGGTVADSNERSLLAELQTWKQQIEMAQGTGSAGKLIGPPRPDSSLRAESGYGDVVGERGLQGDMMVPGYADGQVGEEVGMDGGKEGRLAAKLLLLRLKRARPSSAALQMADASPMLDSSRVDRASRRATAASLFPHARSTSLADLSTAVTTAAAAATSAAAAVAAGAAAADGGGRAPADATAASADAGVGATADQMPFHSTKRSKTWGGRGYDSYLGMDPTRFETPQNLIPVTKTWGGGRCYDSYPARDPIGQYPLNVFDPMAGITAPAADVAVPAQQGPRIARNPYSRRGVADRSDSLHAPPIYAGELGTQIAALAAADADSDAAADVAAEEASRSIGVGNLFDRQQERQQCPQPGEVSPLTQKAAELLGTSMFSVSGPDDGGLVAPWAEGQGVDRLWQAAGGSENKFKCSRCDRAFPTGQSLGGHMRKHYATKKSYSGGSARSRRKGASPDGMSKGSIYQEPS